MTYGDQVEEIANSIITHGNLEDGLKAISVNYPQMIDQLLGDRPIVTIYNNININLPPNLKFPLSRFLLETSKNLIHWA